MDEKEYWEKVLKKANSNVNRLSNKLLHASWEETTVGQRSNMRIKLDNACKERDRAEKHYIENGGNL